VRVSYTFRPLFQALANDIFRCCADHFFGGDMGHVVPHPNFLGDRPPLSPLDYAPVPEMFRASTSLVASTTIRSSRLLISGAIKSALNSFSAIQHTGNVRKIMVQWLNKVKLTSYYTT